MNGKDDFALYVDGGVITHNPSEIGGTWAARLLLKGYTTQDRSGFVTPRHVGMPFVTNNLTEMLAMLNGLSMLGKGWHGTVYSDSQITIGRVSMGYRWKNIPKWMHAKFQRVRADLVGGYSLFSDVGINFVLLDGHPTKAQLAAGIGKRGHPVSEHNVWCDKECGRISADYMRTYRAGEIA